MTRAPRRGTTPRHVLTFGGFLRPLHHDSVAIAYSCLVSGQVSHTLTAEGFRAMLALRAAQARGAPLTTLEAAVESLRASGYSFVSPGGVDTPATFVQDAAQRSVALEVKGPPRDQARSKAPRPR